MDTNSNAYVVGWLIGVVVWIAFIALTVSIARRKGLSPVGWGIFALFFSILACIVVAVMPSRRTA